MKPLILLLALSLGLQADHYDLFLLAGQSNMDGRGESEDLPEALRKPNQDALIFYRNERASSNGWQPLVPGYSTPPKFKKDLPSPVFGPEIGFVQTLQKAESGRKIALIKGSRGGSKIGRDWDPGDAGQPKTQAPLYRDFMETIAQATKSLKEAGHTYTLRGLLWHQGEGDAKMRGKRYQEKLENLIARLKVDLKAPELLVVVGEVFDNGKRDEVRKAIQDTAAASETVGLVSAEGTSTWDEGTHFDAKSQLLLGHRYGEEMLRLSK